MNYIQLILADLPSVGYVDQAWAIVGAVLAAAGIPSAVVGIMVGRINRRIQKQDEERERKDRARVESDIMTRKLLMASISLGEATAEVGAGSGEVTLYTLSAD